MQTTQMKTDFSIFTKNGQISSLGNKKTIVALGTFDGVHIAHRQLIDKAIELRNCKAQGALVGAWCFEKPPMEILKGIKVPTITSIDEKIQLLLSFGLDFVAVGDFARFKDHSAESFITDTLKNDLLCIGTVCGYNHRFGLGGMGNFALLQTNFGESAICVSEITVNGETVSSSAIRSKIMSGNIKGANLMLGRNYFLQGMVVSGKQLGRTMGFPTANQFFHDNAVIPLYGIYAVRCTTDDGKQYIGTANVGIRPSIKDESDSHKVTCETYIHGFTGDLYAKTLTVEFCDLIRAEKEFESIEALKNAIHSDVEKTSKILNN